jgi:DNA-binding IclR family transcriptional regulator
MADLPWIDGQSIFHQLSIRRPHDRCTRPPQPAPPRESPAWRAHMGTWRHHAYSPSIAFSLLACIARHGGRESLPTMAAQCGLSVATAHRLLSTMETLGAVIHVAPGEYRIGMGVLELSRCATQDDLLAATAEAAACGASRRGHRPPCGAGWRIHGQLPRQGDAARPCRATRIGCRLEAYCSALGKVLLAALPLLRSKPISAKGPSSR